MIRSLTSWATCALVAGLMAQTQAAELPDRVEFNRDIRPILSDHCFACHGPDKNKREAELRLDTREGLLGEGSSGPIVAPNKPESSELYDRITSTDADLAMPPASTGKPLDDNQRALLRRWIEQGAPWEGHWAFLPVKRAEPPAPAIENWGRNPIDAFIAADLARQGMSPSPEADRRTLIRRLSLDLCGLPPTVEEVRAFVADERPEAYDELVDRLLARPAYGERLAMWWLDLVRYADSVGYHGDQSVMVFPYRQWVIDALNANKPFDQFTIEQLAGDLLPAPTLEQRIASGYNRLGMMSAEGGVQDKEYLAKYIAERVRNLSGTWMGVTMGCCECHDHKYDPFTTREFYQLEAFFADINERGFYGGADQTGEWGPRVAVPSPEQAAQQAELDTQIAAVRDTLEQDTPELAAAEAAWEEMQRGWAVLRPAAVTSAGGSTLTIETDGSVLALGERPAVDRYTIVIENPPANITALRIEALPDDRLPAHGPGRADNGNFVLTEIAVATIGARQGVEQPVKLENASASYEQTGFAEKQPTKRWSPAGAIDGDSQSPIGWAVLEQVGKLNFAIFQTATDLPAGPGSQLVVRLLHNHDPAYHTLGRFRVSATSAPRPVRAQDVAPAELAAVLALPAAQRTPEQAQALAQHYRSIAPQLDGTRAKLAELEKSRAALVKQIPTTLVTAAVMPRPVRVLPRGNWMDDSHEPLEPGFPAVLSATPASGARLTRLDLARWVISPENPLTARATANRLWKLMFGAGLSRRLDDLGAQGDWPSHPLLLDWLAARFVDSGWDTKQFVRLLVTSSTYRQASVAGSQLRERDPDNRWLAHQASFRLEAELVRDNALRIAGLLVEEVGGPSVHPYQPRGYWAHLNFPTREWQNGHGEQLYRRGLYTHWQRQYLHPALLAFDAPSREECTADRPRSNTPLQALVLLNDPEYVEAAHALAEIALQQSGLAPAERVDWMFERALARLPIETERNVLLALVDKHRAAYASDPAAAGALDRVGEHAPPADIDAAELAAWTSAARAILNMHATITRN